MARATVRMYRPGGIGDCFLLTFGDAPPVHVLIDCGVLLATSGKPQRLRAVAEDIERVTDGHLDVLIATHEHYDHLSGFEFAHGVFERLKIDRVWLAWTEDPDDALAVEIRERHGQAFAALSAAGLALGDDAPNLRGVLEFFGPLAASDRPRGTTAQLDFVHGLVPRPRYLRPGEVCAVAGGAVKAYVLGPPRDLSLLTRSNPSTAASEVYGVALGLEGAFFAGVGLGAEPPRAYPFASRHGIALADAASQPAFAGYFADGAAWRRIDRDWLMCAEMLALRLDEDTNNTSLALAFELPGGDVLLFPADAQVGNWLSWHTVSFADGTAPGDLLARTVLYKVGHHGSHNATLRDDGLERMTSDDLVAMIPVDEAQAGRMGRSGWKMPFGPLYERLGERTKGRILRSDTGLPGTRPVQVDAQTWDAFADRVSEHEVCVAYEVP